MTQAATIVLKDGTRALVDASDLEDLSRYTWLAMRRGNETRAYRAGNRRAGEPRTVFMHRHILRAPDGLQVDHINHDPLDNRRCNLRLCTQAQNSANRRKLKTWSSRFKGVYWRSGQDKWVALIRAHNKRIFLGHHDSEEAAAMMYDAAALREFGEFACLNFPERREESLAASQALVVPRNIGSRHPRARLTETDVTSIRREHESGAATTVELGERYGVRTGTIWDIVTRRVWRHVP